MYKILLTQENTMYGIFNDADELLFEYKYKSQAIDHFRALTTGDTFIPRPVSEYKELG
jgi:hypothetical protein